MGPVRLPDEVSDEQAILISDIFPTGYFGAEMAEITPGDTVVVFGCGPVGQFAILSAFLLGAGRVLAVDRVTSRLEKARDLGAEIINFDEEDPVEILRELTGGIGPDRAIDAVGVDAYHRHAAGKSGSSEAQQFEQQLEQIKSPDGFAQEWHPGDAPGQVLRWAVESLAKAGTLSIIGVYPPSLQAFPIGQAMNKNLAINMGNCNHRKYLPDLVRLVRDGEVDPTSIITQQKQLASALDAYRAFDNHEAGWLKVELLPTAKG